MSPAGWVRDPVVTKELSGLARRWQTYAARGIYVGLFLIVLWNHAEQLSDARIWTSPSGLAELGRSLFRRFSGFQMAMLALSALSSACDLVTKEVRLGTLGLLVCTPLTPGRVTFGKWRAALSPAVSLIFCGLPILALCAAMGGATPRDILVIVVTSLSAAALAASLSLLGSSLLRTPTTALLAGTAAFLLYVFLPLMLDLDPGPTVLNHFHLVLALDCAFSSPGFSRYADRDAWMAASAVATGLSLLILRLTSTRVAALTVRTPAPPVLDRAFGALDRFYEGLGPERFRKMRFFMASTEVWERQAILWKELMTRASGRLRNSVRISLVLLLVLSVTFSLELRKLWIPAWTTTLILWFVALANGTSLFVKEKEERKWDILLATPLGSGQIITAKLLAGAVPVLPMVSTIFFFWFLMVFTTVIPFDQFLFAMAAVTLPAALAYVLGAVCSLQARSLRGAFLLALTLLVALILLLPWWTGEFTTRTGAQQAWISPVTWIDHAQSQSYHWRRRGMEDVLPFAMLYGLLGSGLLGYLYLRFDDITGRSE